MNDAQHPGGGGESKNTQAIENIISPVVQVRLVAVKEFVVADYFGPGITIDGVHIKKVSPIFIERFLPRIERNVPERELSVGMLCHSGHQPLTDLELFNLLSERACIATAHFWQILKLISRNVLPSDPGIKAGLAHSSDMIESPWSLHFSNEHPGFAVTADRINDPTLKWSPGLFVYYYR